MMLILLSCVVLSGSQGNGPPESASENCFDQPFGSGLAGRLAANLAMMATIAWLPKARKQRSILFGAGLMGEKD
jgi:hypothetical protein